MRRFPKLVCWPVPVAPTSETARWARLLVFAQQAQRRTVFSADEALHEVRRTARRISERLPVPAGR